MYWCVIVFKYYAHTCKLTHTFYATYLSVRDSRILTELHFFTYPTSRYSLLSTPGSLRTDLGN